MTTQINVLGSLEVFVDGHACNIGGAQQRRLLAVLLIDAESVVSLDRLVEVQLPDDIDTISARATLRTYVSRLRAAIGDGRVVTRANGYSLSLVDVAIDSIAFEALIRQARVSPAAEAVEVYDEALALWSGPAYAEFAGEWWALPAAARLDELRLLAHEERVDTLLSLGRDNDAVVDLRQLLNANPQRERFAAQLMAALYRTGRQAEAQRVYHSFRAALIERTGLDPSASLTDLDRAIGQGEDVVGVGNQRNRGYVLHELIGRGGYGDVYRSTQPGLHREVAVKAIRAEYADRPSFVRRFEAEAQMVARIEHPHVVPLYDFWRDAGAAYLVFRFLRGGSAERSLVATGPWPLEKVDRLVQEIGGALVAAHAAGIVHRDVKPSNVLFDESGNSYLADFGIALGDGDVRDVATAIRSDVHAFAVMICELLGGGRLSAVDPLASLIALRSGLPEALCGVLERALAPNPDDRFVTIAELLVSWRAALPRSAFATTQSLDEHTDAAAALADRQLQRVNPYKGLRAFAEADAAQFFGRDRLALELSDAVMKRELLIVVGSSGSGKSSLVHAGAVPLLRQRTDLFIVSFAPGAEPSAHMADAISEVVVGQRDNVSRARRDVSLLEQLVPPGDLVMVIDQAEELWTLSDAAARATFLGELRGLLESPSSRVRVVMTVRADFFDRLLDDSTLGPMAQANTFVVTPMTADELHDAVVKPAARVGVTFDDHLVTTIVRDLGTGTTGLPVLQFALAQMYDARTSATITAVDYARIGELGGALARHAEELFAGLGPEGQAEARELFSRLAAPSHDNSFTARRKVRLAETTNVSRAVIDVFADARLLVFDHDSTTREPTVEIAHEALFQQWPRLRGWIDAERAWLEVRRGLTDAAQSWDSSARDDAELFRGSKLERALEHADRHVGSLVGAEQEFLDASVASRDAEAIHAARENRRLRVLLMSVAVVLLAALVAGGVAVVQRRTAATEAHRAETSRVLASAGAAAVTDTPVAALLAIEAGRRGDASARSLDAVMQRVLTAKPHFLGAFPTVGEYLFSADSSMMLARTSFGVEVYGVAEHQLVARAEHPTVRGIGGRRIATNNAGLVVETAGDSEIWRYRLPDLTPAGQPIQTPGSVRALAMSSNGLLVSGQPGGQVIVWDAESGRELRRFSVDDEVFRLDLNADGSRVAVATATATTVYDTTLLTAVGPPLLGSNVDVALSPDGERVTIPHYFSTDTFEVATGTLLLQSTFGAGVRYLDDSRIAISVGTRVDVVAVESGAVVFSIPTTCGCDLAVSPDGTMIVTGLDGPGLYSLDGRQALAESLPAPAGSSLGFDKITMSASGRTLAVAVWYGGTFIYRRTGNAWNFAREVKAPAFAIVVDDDRVLVAGGAEPTFDVMAIDSGQVLSSVPVVGDFGFWFETDPAFTQIAYQKFDGTVVVLDAATGEVTATLMQVRDLNLGNDAPFTDISTGPRYSPDGLLLAASTWSGASVVWTTDGWTASTLQMAGVDVNGASAPAFDRSGRLLAVSEGRRAMSIFDATTLQHVRDLPFPVQGLPTIAAFSADGSRIAVAFDTAIVIVLDVLTGDEIGSPLRVNQIGDMRYLDDGRLAITDMLTDSVLLWDVTTQTMRSRLCALAGRNLTREEWLDVGPHAVDYRRTCEQFPEPPADPTLSRDQPPVAIEPAA